MGLETTLIERDEARAQRDALLKRAHEVGDGEMANAICDWAVIDPGYALSAEIRDLNDCIASIAIERDQARGALAVAIGQRARFEDALKQIASPSRRGKPAAEVIAKQALDTSSVTKPACKPGEETI